MMRLFCLLSSMLFAAAPAFAFVLGGEVTRQLGNGSFIKLSTEQPFDVGQDNFNTDHLYAFDEDQNILLSEPIEVDITPDGEIRSLIPQGTIVASHYVFFDSIDGVQLGYVDFDAPILGIAAYQDSMAATDFLANTRVNYIGTELRGLEQGDMAWIDQDNPTRLWVYWAGSSPGDYIRVFTRKSDAGAYS